MSSIPRPLQIGSRGSELALWQARHIASRLEVISDIVVIKTEGDVIQNISLDKVEGKGFFTKEIEAALLDKTVDLAVHSYKDMPTEGGPEGLQIVVIPERAPVRDVLFIHPDAVDDSTPLRLKKGARLGTSSLRRKAHLKTVRNDIEYVDLRGNVPTRYGKVKSRDLDAVVLAEAGVFRLGIIEKAKADGIVYQPIPLEDVCPAPAQGALAIQIRKDDDVTLAQIKHMHDEKTAACVDAERQLLARFGGGCHLPLGALCAFENGEYYLRALVASPDGSERIPAEATGSDIADIVETVHAKLVERGATQYL